MFIPYAYRLLIKYFLSIVSTHVHKSERFYGVMVSTQDSESCDPSSNLGRTYFFYNLQELSINATFFDKYI